MNIFSNISSYISNKQCFWCHNQEHFFCRQCVKSLEIYEPYCYICKKSSDWFLVHTQCKKDFHLDRVIVLTRYRQKSVKKLLRHAKYYGKYPAYRDIIQQHTDFFTSCIDTNNIIFIPVPMHFLRRWKRGYNQAEKIADIIWNILHIPVYKNIIQKRKYSKQQSHLSLSERQKNLKNSYSLTKKISKIPKNSTIYLIDDIISTGSTLNEIASVLKHAWFNDIRVIVLASD